MTSSITPFLDHAILQISSRLYVRAIVEYEQGDREALWETAVQYVYNVGVAAPIAGLTKENSYDKIKSILAIIRKEQSAESALELIDTIFKISLFFRDYFKDFKFDPTKMRL